MSATTKESDGVADSISKPDSVQDSSPSASEKDLSIEGGIAGIKVWETMELRRSILSMLDRRHLLFVMRVQRRTMVAVGEMLFGRIHVSEARFLTRKSPRSESYRSSVSVVDMSIPPLPSAAQRCTRFATHHALPKRQPQSFSPTLPLITKTMDSFPNLDEMTYLFTDNSKDDTWVSRLGLNKKRGNMINEVDLDTPVEVDVDIELVGGAGPVFPAPPIFQGIKINQTYSVRLISGRGARIWTPGEKEREEHVQRWVTALGAKKLDDRVRSLDRSEVSRKEFPAPSLKEWIMFLEQRRNPAWREIKLEAVGDDQLVDLIRIFDLIGHSLLKLTVNSSTTRVAGGIHALFEILNKFCPSLLFLSTTFYDLQSTPSLDHIPLKGLNKLAIFRYEDLSRRRMNPEDVCRVGNKRTIYQDMSMEGKAQAKTFQEWVQMSRRCLIKAEAKSIEERAMLARSGTVGKGVKE